VRTEPEPHRRRHHGRSARAAHVFPPLLARSRAKVVGRARGCPMSAAEAQRAVRASPSPGGATHEHAMAALRQASFLAGLDEATLAEVVRCSEPRRYGAGERIIGELEFGADVFVIVRGEAEVSVDAKTGERRVLGRLGPGSAFGEMSSLTGEL